MMEPFAGGLTNYPAFGRIKVPFEECREELEGVIDDWLLLGLRLGHIIPPLGGIDLNVDLAKAI